MVTFTATRTAAVSGSTAVGNAFILQHLRSAPENCVKVYLFALMQMQNPSLCSEDICAALELSEEDVVKALLYWQDAGVLRIITDSPLYVEFDAVTMKDAVYFDAGASKYSDLISALRDVLGGRIFTANDMRVVYDWVEVFGLSEEAAVLVVQYCISAKGSRVSMRYMNEVARSWAENGIVTADDAKRYIAENAAYTDLAKEIKKRWRLTRNVTEDELALCRKWAEEWGLSRDVILAACEEMVNASNPSFGYLDSVLESYRARGTTDRESLNEYRRERIALEDFARTVFIACGLKRKPSSQQVDQVGMWLNEWRIPKTAIIAAAEKAAGSARPFDKLCKTVASWNERDIRNADDARADLASGANGASAASASSKKKTNYPQRKYTGKDLAALGIIPTGGAEDDDTSEY